jgi:hypothetical protein
MRYVFGFLCVCALSVMPGAGCDFDILEGANPCEGENCDDGNRCTRGHCRWPPVRCEQHPVPDGMLSCSVDGVSGVCMDGVCDLCEGVECEDGVCLNGVCVIDQCTADDLAALEAGDEPNMEAWLECVLSFSPSEWAAGCVSRFTSCMQDFETSLSTECLGCIAGHACCMAGPCECGFPLPVPDCQMCVEQDCRPPLASCIGGQWSPPWPATSGDGRHDVRERAFEVQP